MRAEVRTLVACVLAALVLAACGEPEVDLDVPDRAEGQRLLDVADVMDDSVEEALAQAAAATDLDIVALAFEDERASLGQADRGGSTLLAAWDADVVVVVVGFPGDLTADDPEARARYFGVYGDRFDVPRSVREQINDEVVAPLAADNDWTGAFTAAAETLAVELEDR